MQAAQKISERIIRINGTPADFILDSSYRSARFPITITEAINTAIGKAIGNVDTDKYPINSNMIKILTPLPAISSIYSHKNCMISTNNAIKNDTAKGPIKLVSRSLSIFFKVEEVDRVDEDEELRS